MNPEPVMTDWCSECGAPIAFVTHDDETFRWEHTPEMDDHDASPDSVTLRAVTAMYQQAREAK